MNTWKIRALWALLGVPVVGYAQPVKGDFTVGGTISGYYDGDWERSVGTEKFGGTIAPQVGVFLNDHWLVGGTLGASTAQTRFYENNNRNENWGMAVGAEVSYYFGSNRWTPFAYASLQLQWSDFLQLRDGVENSYSRQNSLTQIGGGVAYWLAPKVALQGKLIYMGRGPLIPTSWGSQHLNTQFGVLFLWNRSGEN
ncbi:MAG: outer membrane beta-barrel protein [Bacteroidota bacterium]